VSGRGGSLVAKYFTRDLEKALAAAERLESAGLRPNIARSNANYVVYIATADLLRLAERDEAVRSAVAQYLAEKVKNGTPRQREIAEKILKRHPLFSTDAFLHP
jgi:predicted nucleic acid-binding protein